MAPQKNMALGKFWPDLEVWKAFLIGLEVSFSGDFASRGLELFFKSRCRVSKLAFSRSLEFAIPMTPKSIP